jgi:Flp pilus assembly pilin Flp
VINNIILKGIAFVSNTIASFKEEHGQDLIEYAVLAGALGLVAAVAFVALPVKDTVDTFVKDVGNCLAMNSSCT